MASIIITGATGTVGSAVLTQALASPSISKVTVLARRAPAVQNPKLETILLPSETFPEGFSSWPEGLVERVRSRQPTAVVWALGVSQRDVKEDEYVKITHDYTVASARALSTLGTPSTPFKYIFVSGMGADQAEKGWAIFSRVKGRAEKALVNIENESDNSFRAVNIRPGGIIPTDERKAQLPWLARVGVPLLGYVMPSRMIHANDVATAALQLAATEDGWEKRDKEQLIIENDGLNEIAKRYAQVWQS